MIACLDVDYRDRGAVAAGVWFRGWSAAVAESETAVTVDEVAAYEPGAFFRRELPCLLAVLAAGPRPDVVVVDGYVWLADEMPGLGKRLHDAVGGVVIGVAKTKFASCTSAVPVLRGGSNSPLYITAVVATAAEAACWVAAMHGPYRTPTLLKRVDTLARSSLPNAKQNAMQ